MTARELAQLRLKVIRRCACVNELRSRVHGPAHWTRVARNGAELAPRTPGASRTLVRLFALFHDAERRSEGPDPHHGARGLALAQDLGVLDALDERERTVLAEALVYHDAGGTSDDPTIGVCWDADRLDLPRVGIWPDARFLSTTAAKALLAARA